MTHIIALGIIVPYKINNKKYKNHFWRKHNKDIGNCRIYTFW